MNNDQEMSCTKKCWLSALLGGILAAILLLWIGGSTFLQALFLGVVIIVLGGFILNWLLCKDVPETGSASGHGQSGSGRSATGAAAAGGAAMAAGGAAAAAGAGSASKSA